MHNVHEFEGVLWISWENHRRSRELAGALGIPFLSCESRKSRPWRYLVLLAWTLRVLLSTRPKTVFCQNPSIVLAWFLSSTKWIFRYSLIVDRHSNFKFHTRSQTSLKWRVFHWLSKYSLVKADLTIVTTRKLAKWVYVNGGRAVVLHDKIPDLTTKPTISLEGRPVVIFICTYSWDEPIDEVLKAVEKMPPESILYVTGRAPNVLHRRVSEINDKLGAKRVVLTGFLSEQDYRSYLQAADIVLVLTTVEDVLLCGAYEAIALSKPLVLSRTKALQSLFNLGVTYCDNDCLSIAKALNDSNSSLVQQREEIVQLKANLELLWVERFSILLENLRCLGYSPTPVASLHLLNMGPRKTPISSPN